VIPGLIGEVFATPLYLKLVNIRNGDPCFESRVHSTLGFFWVTHMIVKTLASACLLLEIRWQKARQADKMRTCTHTLPTILDASSNFLSQDFST
jgi:hypothetical protein